MSNQTQYYADRPISNARDDLLNRIPFANTIAQSLSAWRGKDSLVVALHGQWGSGKSSVKNLVEEVLAQTPGSVDILEFNPWRINGPDQLVDSFFRSIGKLIGRPQDKNRTQAAAKWEQYAHLVSGGIDLSKGLSKALPITLATLSAMGLLSATRILPVLSNAFSSIWIVVLIAAAMLLRGSGRFATWMAGWLSRRQRVIETGLEQTKRELHSYLAKLKKPIVIIIDDIDRLSPAELHLVLKLVKANGDFPNLTYLLLYDTEQVEAALKSLGIQPRSYMEKIVQVVYRIPSISQDTIDKILFHGVEQILRDEQVELDDEELHRFANAYYDGVQTCFTSLRDVYRHLSSFSFHCSLMKRTGSMEVNAVDLAVLEAIRLNEPSVYERLPSLKETLTQEYDSNTEIQISQTLQVLRDSAQPRYATAIESMLKHLFPQVSWTQGMLKVVGGPKDDWLYKIRVCHPEVFSRFFQLEIPSGDVSHADMAELLDVHKSKVQLLAKFNELRQRGLLEPSMRRLDAFKDRIPLEYAVPFLIALSDISDHLSSERPPWGFDASSNADRIVYWYLLRFGTPEERAQILEKVFERTSGLSLPQHVVYSERRSREAPNERRTNLVTNEQLVTLETIFLDRLREKVSKNLLAPLATPHLGPILLTWEKLSTIDEVREWTRKVLNEKNGAITLLSAFVQTVYSSGLGDRVARSKKYIQVEVLEKYVDLQILDSILAEIKLTELVKEEKEAIEAYKDAKTD